MTALADEREPRPPVSRELDGSVTLGSYALARRLLRSRDTEQAGFNAELARRLPQKNISVLFQEGERHRRQRSAAAAFFTPAAVRNRYRPLIARTSRTIVDRFVSDGRGVLDEMSLELTVGVVAEIIGLTESRDPGLGHRLSRIFSLQARPGGGLGAALAYTVGAYRALSAIYLKDVRPAIKARRRAPREDLVSSLIEQGWSSFDILTECVTYGTAGLSTTREFIVAAALHLLGSEPLRQRYLAGTEEDQHAILGEILRLEPAVNTLKRRAVRPARLDGSDADAEAPTLAAGQLVAVDIRSANADPALVGPEPYRLRPERPSAASAGLSFGDGHHRCPGASVALTEAALFLDDLLRVPGIAIETGPVMTRHPVSTGYVLRGATLTAHRG